jgi:hypothetical protein
MFTMNDKWILFSYSIPAINAKARMRIWRRISATGAVQLKTGLQILPNREDLLENITWLIGEVHSLGGEAFALQCARIEGMTDVQLERLFQAQIDPEFAQIQAESQEVVAVPAHKQSGDGNRERVAALRKLRKRYEALREKDFFPSGAATKTLALLDTAGEKLRNPEIMATAPRPLFDRTVYQGRTWTTRAHPYIDRLSSFWLIRRFIDPQATIRFLQPTEGAAAGEVSFDMSDAEFSHQGEMITFEVMARGFGLVDPQVTKIGELIKDIDVQEGALPDDAALLKTLLDGLIVLSTDDHQLLERSLLLFDALHAGFIKNIQGGPQ